MAARRATGLAIALVACAVLVAPALAGAQDAGTRIVGGDDAQPGEYPWQVSVRQKSGPGFSFICGGTLIADGWVLTAAHCTTAPGPAEFQVRVGSQLRESGGTLLNVSSHAEHPQFNSSTLEYDAALLDLSGSGIAAGGQPLQLIGQEGSGDNTLWSDGKPLGISGWGDTLEGGDLSSQLQEAEVPRVADSTCGHDDYYGTEFFQATMVCAGLAGGGVDTCQGDSGGPLVASTQDPLPTLADDPTEWRLVGVTSWGEGCARAEKPGVYTRLAAPAIRDWILGQISTPPPPTQHTLTVTKSGSGSGTVSGGGINCGTGCSQDSLDYDEGTDVTLTASAASGSTFAGWTGACSGTGSCLLSMDGDRSVTATFGVQASTPAPPPEDDPDPEPDPEPEPEPDPDPDPDDPPTTSDETPPVAEIASNRLRMSRRGFVRVRIDCGDSPEDCLGVVRIRLRFRADATAAALRTVGRAKFDIAAGDDKRVKLRLKRRARRLVRRKGRVKVRVVAIVEDAAGNSRRLRDKLRLRARK